MHQDHVPLPPRWLFVLLAIGTAWASGVYMGQVSVLGMDLIPALKMGAFAVVSIVLGVSAVHMPDRP